MEEEIRRHERMSHSENKTGTTIAPSACAVTVDSAALPYGVGRCGYVIAPGATPFCDRPTLRGSSYCVWHRALCDIAPPPELGRLIALPEFFDESEDERLAGLDLPAPAVAHDE